MLFAAGVLFALLFGFLHALFLLVLKAAYVEVALEHDEHQQSRREQTQFISSVSHELRTPLTAILSAAAAMERAEGEERHVFSQVIDREGRRMGRLITDMLTLASADSGGWQLRPRPTEPDIVALDAYETYAPQAREKGLKLLLELPEELPTVTADPDRLGQALAILLDNALSYTPAPGRITLGAQVFGKKLRFTVADTGPGVPEGETQQIFQRFMLRQAFQAVALHAGLHPRAVVFVQVARCHFFSSPVFTFY